jgi:hypothetical protein
VDSVAERARLAIVNHKRNERPCSAKAGRAGDVVPLVRNDLRNASLGDGIGWGECAMDQLAFILPVAATREGDDIERP